MSEKPDYEDDRTHPKRDTVGMVFGILTVVLVGFSYALVVTAYAFRR